MVVVHAPLAAVGMVAGASGGVVAVATTPGDLAQLITAVAVLITAIATLRGVRKVHDEVKTANGISMAALADRQEGRRVIKEVPDADDRTESEQGYVDNLEEGGRNPGHGGEPPLDPTKDSN